MSDVSSLCRRGVVLFLVAVVAVVAGFETVRGPPKVHPFEPYVVRPQGENLRLPCPATANPDPFFDWMKDGETLDQSWDLRIKQKRGLLKIQELKPEDAGTYICKVVNGFGSADVAITVLVLDRSQVPDSELGKKGSIGKAPTVVKAESGPEGVAVPGLGAASTTGTVLLLRTRQGSRANFSCEADGLPVPEIQWFKDGKFLHPGSWDRRQLRGPKLSTLVFDSVTSQDRGLYSCRAVSPLGAHTKNFSLEVEAENLTAIKPELAGLHPENTTVSVGEVAALQCVIVADGPPHVEWLKQMEPQELAEYDKLRKKNSLKQGQQQPEVIGDRKTTDFNGKPHWILNVGSRSSQGVESGNRTHYVSKLVIARASIGDTGTYVCLAANSMGYNYREARLIVRDHLRNSPPVLMDVPGESMQSPFSIPLIVILLVGPIVCLVMIGIFWKCSRKTATSGASVDPRSVTCSGLASDLGTAFTGKHDLNSVRTSDSSLGTPAHLRTPSKCWQAYYPVPTSSIQRAPSHMQRLYYNNQQQSLCDEAYEELDFVRRSPAGVVDDFAWDGSHNRTATTPSTFDGYDQLPVPGFHAFGPGRTGFRIIQNPNAFVK